MTRFGAGVAGKSALLATGAFCLALLTAIPRDRKSVV